LVTTRIQTTRRRLGTSPGRHGRAARRRRSTWPLLASVASGAAAQRLGVSAHARSYLAAAALMTLVMVYLVVGAQATQTSYELDRLKNQHAQLQAEQGQLRYQDVSMHTPAGVQRAAASAGMQRPNQPRFAGYQPIALDLNAPIGPDRPSDAPLWKRALALVIGGAGDVWAAGR
jgi:cell division protein FtsL